MLPDLAGLILIDLPGHLNESLIHRVLQLLLPALDLFYVLAVVVNWGVLEVFVEVDLRVMSLVMLLQVLLRQEEFGAVLAFHHVLLLLGRESQ